MGPVGVTTCIMVGFIQVASMVTRLSTGDWFTAKVSACGLFTAAYKHITDGEQRAKLREQASCWRSSDCIFCFVCDGLFEPMESSHDSFRVG